MKKIFSLFAAVLMAVSTFAAETLTYETGFESTDGFTATTTYNTVVTQGPTANQWETLGTATTNDKKSGSQGLQMRVYKTQSDVPYAQTMWDIENISKVTFYMRTDGTAVCKNLIVKYSLDGGESWTTAETIAALSSWGSTPVSVTIPEQSSTMRIRFEVDYAVGSNTQKITIDDVKIYTDNGGSAVAVTGVSLNKTATGINVHESETLIATITPADATNKSVTWASDATGVATVSDKGVVTGVSAGEAHITVTTKDGNYTATCTVTVTAVPVAGVSLDQTSLTLLASEEATLVATILPENASNQNITWASDNEDVATVEDGVVLAVAEGTANITVTTEDGNYTATCVVKVKPAPYQLAYTFDFTVNNFGLPTSAQKGKEGSYTYDGKTIKLYGDASNGFKFNSDGYLIFGKKGAYLTLPAFDFPVGKIVVEGKSGASGSTVQNIFVGDVAVSTATTGATGTNTYIINEDYRAAGNVYTLKVTSSHNTQVTAVKIYRYSEDPIYAEETLTLVAENNSGYWATFSNEKVTFWPEDYVVNAAVADGEDLVLFGNGYIFDEDNVEIGGENIRGYYVPANTGVLVKSADAEATYYTVENVSVDAIEDNNLRAASVAMEGDFTFYKLAYDNYSAKTGLGFYYGAAEGAPFTAKAGGAYLAVPTGSAAPARFLLNATDEVTALENVAAVEGISKKVVNGRLFILRDGKTFDVVGRIVK